MYNVYVSKWAYIKDVYKESYSVRLCKEIRQRAVPFVVFLDLSETAEDQLNEVTKAAFFALSQKKSYMSIYFYLFEIHISTFL